MRQQLIGLIITAWAAAHQDDLYKLIIGFRVLKPTKSWKISFQTAPHLNQASAANRLDTNSQTGLHYSLSG